MIFMGFPLFFLIPRYSHPFCHRGMCNLLLMKQRNSDRVRGGNSGSWGQSVKGEMSGSSGIIRGNWGEEFLTKIVQEMNKKYSLFLEVFLREESFRDSKGEILMKSCQRIWMTG